MLYKTGWPGQMENHWSDKRNGTRSQVGHELAVHSETSCILSGTQDLYLPLRHTNLDLLIGHHLGRWEWLTDSGKAIPHERGEDNEPTCVGRPCVLGFRALQCVLLILSYLETYSLIKTSNRFFRISMELGKRTRPGTVWHLFLLVAWLPTMAA